MPKVSILMNCYNGEKYLKEAIDSIYQQTFSDWEIVFIDNCSTDSSASIVKSYGKKIKYYKTDKNIPLGAARNFGLKFISGEYLAFLDTDDIWMFDKLERQLKAIRPEMAFVYSPVIQIDSKGEKLRITKTNKDNKFETLLKRYDINMHSTLINLNLVKFEFNEKLFYCPDYELFMNIAAKGYIFYSLNIPLVKYRIHDKSLSSKTTDIQMKEILLVLSNIKINYPMLDKKYRNSFNIALSKFQYLINAKTFLNRHNYQSASNELFKLSKYDIKYLIISFILIIPFFKKIIYTKFLYRYI